MAELCTPRRLFCRSAINTKGDMAQSVFHVAVVPKGTIDFCLQGLLPRACLEIISKRLVEIRVPKNLPLMGRDGVEFECDVEGLSRVLMPDSGLLVLHCHSH